MCLIPKRWRQIANLLRSLRMAPLPVLCPGPPVLSLFCLGTGGCQSGFMSSSPELKEVSFMSCYETRRPCLSGAMRSVLGEPGVQGTGPSLGGDQQWGSQSSFCVAAVAACLVIIHSLNMSTTQAFQERTQRCRRLWVSAQHAVDNSQQLKAPQRRLRTARLHVSFLCCKPFLFCSNWLNMQEQRHKKKSAKSLECKEMNLIKMQRGF